MMMRWLGSAALAVATAAMPLAGGHGVRWSIQPTPNSAAASGLGGVLCTSPNACIAVGFAETVSFAFRTLAQRWDGRTWTLQAMPKPARSDAVLADVSCLRAADCFAVGSAGNGTLVEHWNGRSWQIQGSGTGRHGSLASVSCSGPDACTAVGFSGTHRLLAERWDGERWTIQHPPSRWKSPLLSSVSCPSATDCTAVGISGDTGPTFAERWTHGRWKIQATRNPTKISFLFAVSCSAPNACTATGYYEKLKILATETVLVERWNGRVWKLGPTPAKASLSGGLTGVSCPSASDCTAVGSGGPPRGRQSVLVEHWNGQRWRFQSTPVVKSRSSPQLNDISCAAPENCTAVGYYLEIPGNGQEKTLAERHGS
jgi:hypothetical protein